MFRELSHKKNHTSTPAGRVCRKFQDYTGTGNVYAYSPNNKQHAVRRIYNGLTNELSNLLWDNNGNLAQIAEYSYDPATEITTLQDFRNHYWNEDDRLNLVLDNSHFAYYLYGYDGQRVAKITSDWVFNPSGNGGIATWAEINDVVLYLSEYLVADKFGYTKYYYAGGTRIAARWGGGGFDKMQRLCTLDRNLTHNASDLFNAVVARIGENMPLDCPSDPCPAYNNDMAGFRVPLQPLNFEPNYGITAQQNVLQTFRQNYANEETFFFHGNHLGSANWVTLQNASPTQFLLHLPYGEEFIKQLSGSYDERFTFTGKEKDVETGYYYFGARFDNVDLGFMSVDPMSDKYPGISPYAYCAWNPVKLVDIKGLDTAYYNLNGNKLFTKSGGSNINMMIVTDEKINSDKYNSTRYYSFDVATIETFIWDDMYRNSEKENVEYGYAIKGNGHPTDMCKGDNHSVEIPFDESYQYDVHIHCKYHVNEDKSLSINEGAVPSPSKKDTNGIGSKFGIILGYHIESNSNYKWGDISNNYMSKRIGFYNANGSLYQMSYDKFKKTIEKIQGKSH